ncbi:MAG: hypothetical protein JKY34_07385 [Kordiimonadaceae bacterium]|nr:hypothetical protein [Kordiimonadaceae bacterium]
MRLHTQFPANQVAIKREGGKIKARLFKLLDGREQWLPESQIIACTECRVPASRAGHWVTVTNWIARKKDIQDARTPDEIG